MGLVGTGEEPLRLAPWDRPGGSPGAAGGRFAAHPQGRAWQEHNGFWGAWVQGGISAWCPQRGAIALGSREGLCLDPASECKECGEDEGSFRRRLSEKQYPAAYL
ncbi:hypothetical protein VULLAG_LOCUS8557 [Vulpes lagopus]